MTDPTPGPWSVESGANTRHENGNFAVYADGDCEFHAVADCSCNHTCRTHDECGANASLIAAAPDLLAALQVCRTDLMIHANNADHAARSDPNWEGVGAKLRVRIAEADAAIAKATGEAGGE